MSIYFTMIQPPTLFLLISLFMLGFACFKKHKKTAQLAAQLKAEKEIQVVRITKASLEARDEERHRIAQDWHDGIGNSLSTLKLLIDSIKTENPTRLQEIQSLLENTQLEFRQIIDKEYIASFSNRQEIIGVLQKWQNQLKLGDIDFEFKVSQLPHYPSLPKALKKHFYRMLQELMGNAIAHAEATTINVTLKETPASILLNITDNGKGINAVSPNVNLLSSAKQRLEILNGNMTIASNPQMGTSINIIIEKSS